jgi:hypothetical protein
MTEKNENNNEVEKRKYLYKKDDKYGKEQKEILERLNKILGITETNDKFIVEEIDGGKQKEIKNMEAEVIQYYPCSIWPYFNKHTEKKWTSFIKSIYKHGGYEFELTKKSINKKMQRTYRIIKKV